MLTVAFLILVLADKGCRTAVAAQKPFIIGGH
jgi:hypothetical protein